MNSKFQLRKQLEAGMAVFLSDGKQIKKLPTYGKKRKPKIEEEQSVEIEVAHLPTALQKKFFGEQ